MRAGAEFAKVETVMLTVLTLAAVLTLQAQRPTAPLSTWDGTPGGHTTVIDQETGEITYPMGQQPANALALGCVFGRLNVRCPRPLDEARPAPGAGPDADWRTGGSERFGAIAFSDTPPASQHSKVESVPVDCVMDEPAEGQRLCTFDEALSNSYRARPPAVAAAEADAPPAVRDGCRREAFSHQDGSGGGVRLVCGSGDTRAIDALRQTVQPFPR